MITIPLWIQSAIWFIYFIMCWSQISTMAHLFRHLFSTMAWQYQVVHVLWVIMTAFWIPWNVHNLLG